MFLTEVLGAQNTVSHEIFCGSLFCGLVIFCVLRELSFVIRTDCFAKIGTRKNFVPHGKTEHLFTHCLVCLLVGFSLGTKRHCNSYRVLKPKCEHFCCLSKCMTPLSSQSKNIRRYKIQQARAKRTCISLQYFPAYLNLLLSNLVIRITMNPARLYLTIRLNSKTTLVCSYSVFMKMTGAL